MAVFDFEKANKNNDGIKIIDTPGCHRKMGIGMFKFEKGVVTYSFISIDISAVMKKGGHSGRT